MDEDKLLYLEQNGYKPITDEIICEWLGCFNPKSFEEKVVEIKKKYTHYKRYNGDVMLFSPEYLERARLGNLKTDSHKQKQRPLKRKLRVSFKTMVMLLLVLSSLNAIASIALLFFI